MSSHVETAAPAERAGRPAAPEYFRNYVGGEWVASRSTSHAPNVNPADTRVTYGHVVLSSASEATDAVEAARAAFPAWRDTPAPTRGQLLLRAWELLRERADRIATILSMEEGKTLAEARGEVQKTINVLEFIGGEGRRLSGETTPSEMRRTFCYTTRHPLGVVGLITPWNFPAAIPVWKAAPALVAGNTVVWKPATLTPWTSAEIMQVFADAGFPAGVINMVYGGGNTVGTAIVDHPAVRGVSFTGSTEVGAGIYARGATRLLKVQCEMGGKNPLVVCDDADIELAATSAVQGAFGSTGQRCTATSRAIVFENVADDFVRRVAEKTRAIVVGDPLAPGVTMGPSVDAAQFAVVTEALDRVRADGLRAVTGGARLADGEYAHGYFAAPTVLDHIVPSMSIARDEVFGPILCVMRVRDLDEAIAVANDVAYGLSSSIYSNDVARVFTFLDRIETGITHVNSPTVGGEAQLPFGGIKDTGVGPREQGRTAIEFFTELKTVYVDYTGTKRESLIY